MADPKREAGLPRRDRARWPVLADLPCPRTVVTTMLA